MSASKPIRIACTLQKRISIAVEFPALFQSYLKHPQGATRRESRPFSLNNCFEFARGEHSVAIVFTFYRYPHKLIINLPSANFEYQAELPYVSRQKQLTTRHHHWYYCRLHYLRRPWLRLLKLQVLSSIAFLISKHSCLSPCVIGDRTGPSFLPTLSHRNTPLNRAPALSVSEVPWNDTRGALRHRMSQHICATVRGIHDVGGWFN